MSPQQTRLIDSELAAYFTDVDPLRDLFKNLVAAPTLPKRLLIIHGVGGVGKSSLLRMFRLHCENVRVPTALVSGDEARSAVYVLRDWYDGLKDDGLVLPTFAQTWKRYQDIQLNVEQQASKAASSLAGTAKTVAEVVLSTVPGLGPLAGKLAGESAGLLVDWLSDFLSKPDVELVRDPTKRLTDDFVGDIVQLAPKRRLVLMLDTFERVTALDNWVRDLARQLQANALLVIAGRDMPNWDRDWPGWLAQAEVRELGPMSQDDMLALIGRYYAVVCGGEPNPAQREAIVHFARGLPLAVTSAVQLWVQYGVEDFQSVRPRVMENLVDRLREGMPPETYPILEIAATVRWFNKDILRALTSSPNVDTVYNNLRRLPLMRPHAEGLSVHGEVREIFEEHLRVNNSHQYLSLHQKAITDFKERLEQARGEEADQLQLELLYHHICADEKIGLPLFQDMAEKLVRHRLVNPLRALLNDVNSYTLRQENSRLWRQYYNASLFHLEAKLDDAEREYEAISQNPSVEPKLRAYALCSWGEILAKYDRLGQPGGIGRAIRVLEQSLGAGLQDSHLSASYLRLAHVAGFERRWDSQIEYLERARKDSEQRKDSYGLASVYVELKRAKARRGIWKDTFSARNSGMAALSQIPLETRTLKAMLLAKWAWAWALAGRLSECERDGMEARAIVRDLQDEIAELQILRDVGWAVAAQGRFIEADSHFCASLEIAQRLNLRYEQGATLGFWGASLSWSGRLDEAQVRLNQSREIKSELKEEAGILEPLNWLAIVAEMQGQWNVALEYYQKCLATRWGRYYFECSALTGLVRVKYIQHDYSAIPLLLNEAESLAQQYEYNDHLASLRLIQGHVAWDGRVSEWGEGSNVALHYYQQALIHALRYNRFLLDQVLSGHLHGAPLRPIIPCCLERGGEGREMLIALQEWWHTGVNDIGAPRPDTIAPIHEGMPLPTAERSAREREQGDGAAQTMVNKQIEMALATLHSSQ